ncbi:MAG TPA: hypothetical protein PK563_15995, partial [Tenuifilaceae bacterium]|nr:hypothetical protein [Tenuifilaceae bacterium]
MYLGSKAVGATGGVDGFDATLKYDDVKNFLGSDLGSYPVDSKNLTDFAFTPNGIFDPGTTSNVDFKISYETTDGDIAYYFYMEFPAGVTFNSATDIGPLQLYDWDDDWAEWYYMGGAPMEIEEIYDFSVNVTVDESLTDPSDVYYYFQTDDGWWTQGWQEVKPFYEFDIYLYPSSKTATDPILFGEENIPVTFKTNTATMKITEDYDLTVLNPPLVLDYTWVDNIPEPLNEFTLPVFEYSTDEGMTWTLIETYPFTGQLDIEDEMITETTRFRWRQPYASGTWDVVPVQIITGDYNVLAYIKREAMPVTIGLAKEMLETPVPVDPCEGFTAANIEAYEFTVDTTTVEAGSTFEFDWNFLLGGSKAPATDTVSVSDPMFYVHGTNTMEFNLDYDVTSKLTEFKMTFPTGVVPAATASQAAIELNGNTLTPVVNAQVITWTSAAGVISGSIDINFDVVYSVVATVNTAFDVTWSLTDGAGTVTGKVSVAPANPFPEGTVFTFSFKDGAVYREAAQTTELGTVEAIVPATLVTGVYDIYVKAEYETVDEDGDPATCGPTAQFMVYDNMFVISAATPEVYEI